MKIVVAEKVAAEAIALLRNEGWEVVEPAKEQLLAAVADADALIVRSAVLVDARLLQAGRKLRVVGRAGVGVDNIDAAAATRLGIAVMNTPGVNAVAVAEFALAAMLALARQLPLADRTMHGGHWEKKRLQGNELRAKTLGIVGLGRIGLEVARRAAAFGMTLLGHDPFVAGAALRDLGVRLVTLDELYTASDYITLHVGLTPQTAGMINPHSLAQMKRGVRLVNCARGELVDEAALAEALRSGHVAGAALDVFAQEPPRELPFRGLDNVILTPHIGGSTVEAQEAVGTQIALQVREFLKRGVIQNAVNVPSMSDEEYHELLPYVGLAEKLGSFVAQITEGNAEMIEMRYIGRLAGMKTDLVRNAVILGLLNQLAVERANLVNAAQLAAERGIEIEESWKEEGGGAAGTVLKVSLRTDQRERRLTGAVLGGLPRLLAIGDIMIEVPLARNLLYLENRDVPGVVGRVGMVLGDHQVNIASFALGRAEVEGHSAGHAVAVVQVDGPVGEPVVRKVREIPAIQHAKAIQL